VATMSESVVAVPMRGEEAGVVMVVAPKLRPDTGGPMLCEDPLAWWPDATVARPASRPAALPMVLRVDAGAVGPPPMERGCAPRKARVVPLAMLVPLVLGMLVAISSCSSCKWACSKAPAQGNHSQDVPAAAIR
jgi:hypothetical protein